MSLNGKNALVVGGGRGIGAATVKLLAEQGATVTFSYAKNMVAAEAVAEQARQFGGRVKCWQSNAFDADQVKMLVERAYELEHTLDIVVKSVPPLGDFKPFSHLTWDEFIRPVDTELKTDYELSQAALFYMGEQQSGHLVFVTSSWAKYPTMTGLSGFTPAFAAQAGFVKALAKEVGPDGITVNTVAPGMVDTDLSRMVPSEVRQQMAAITPLGRIATAEDVARVIVFLASDASGFMTGSYIPVSGGLTME